MYTRSRGFGQISLTPPISGSPTISSLFGPRAQPTAGASTDHQGIDYAVPIGTPVLAAGDGTVIFAGVQSGYGNVVEINNGNGVMTLYGHLSQINVSVGQSVSDGDQIALSGNTGTTTGPNLHFGVYENGVAVDPTTTLLSTSGPVDTSSDYTDTTDTSGTTDLSALGTDLSSDFSDLTDSTQAGTLDPSVLAFGVGIGILVVLGIVQAR